MKKRVAEHDEFADIRTSVRALCAKFPGEYWRALDRERAYPTEFVAALTEAGYLAALIPEEYGGSGLNLGAAAAILEEVHASGTQDDVDVSPCAGAFDELDEGVTSVTIAYVLFIHLMVVCPLIRLMSVSMKENAKRR
jgi:hypothetical protein